MKNGAWEHEKEPETRDQEPGKVKSHRNQELGTKNQEKSKVT